MKLLRLVAGLITGALALVGAGAPASARAQQPTNTPLTITGDPNLMLDEMLALQPEQRNLAARPAQAVPYATAKPNFGGFRVAPYTPAHAPSTYTARIVATVEADFNHDGLSDVVVFQSLNLTLMAGNGKGGFSRVASQTTASNVYHPVAVDLNHDGYPDIVAMTLPYGYAGTAVVLMNQKNGTFAAPVVISHKASVYSGLMSMNVADIDGDGNYDVVITGAGTQDNMPNTYAVFETIFGNGDGTFRTASPKDTIGLLPYKDTVGFDGATVLRKVNGNWILFAAIMQTKIIDGVGYSSTLMYQFPVAASGSVNISGASTFQVPTITQANAYVSFTDVNQDGIDDIVYLSGDAQVYVLPGKSDGSYGSAIAALPGGFTVPDAVVSFADVNHDGNLDLILAGSPLVAVYPGRGDGTFGIPKVTYNAGYGTYSITGLTYPIDGNMIDDFDGDGVADVLFFDTAKRTMSFYKGKSDGTFVGAPALVSASGNYPTNTIDTLAVPDLNGDGTKDVITSSGYGLMTGLNDGKGNYTYTPAFPSVMSVVSVSQETGDFNKDGKDDVVMFAQQGTAYQLYIGFSNGDGTLNAVRQTLPYTASTLPTIKIADLNGDGYPDLALTANNAATASYGVWTMLNDGKGNLLPGQFLKTTGSVYAIAMGDTTGDGIADLFVAAGTYASTPTGEYINNGTGVFHSTADRVLQSTLPVSQILVRDATGDGVNDLLLAISSGASEGLQLYAGNNDGTFAAPVQLAAGLVTNAITVNDYNGDGVPDIAYLNYETVLSDATDNQLGLVLLRGAGGGMFAAPLAFGVYGGGRIFHSVDLDNSGALSILADGGSGTTILHNVGATMITVSAAKVSGSITAAYPVTVNVAPFFNDQPAATGTVSVLVDGTVAGTAGLNGAGSATINLSSLSAGKHLVTATYSGDSNFNVNMKSTSVGLTVTKTSPAFSVSANTAALVVPSGSTGMATVSLTANESFSGPVTLSCAGLPKYSACGFDQTSVTLAPGQTSTVNVSIVTQNVTANLEQPLSHSSSSGIAFASLLLICALGLHRRRPAALLIALFSLSALLLVGCSNFDPTKKPASGTYAVTITASPTDITVASQAVTVAVTLQ